MAEEKQVNENSTFGEETSIFKIKSLTLGPKIFTQLEAVNVVPPDAKILGRVNLEGIWIILSTGGHIKRARQTDTFEWFSHNIGTLAPDLVGQKLDFYQIRDAFQKWVSGIKQIFVK